MRKEPVVALGSQRYRVERPWGVLPPSRSFAGIADVTVMPSGNVIVLLRGDPALYVFDPNGSLIKQRSLPDIVAGHYVRATAHGRLLLCDFDGHRVFLFAANGSCQQVLGDRDHPRFGAPFNHPADAVEAPDGEIFVADGYGNSCVHRFNAQGDLLATWGSPGSGPLEFSTPHAVAIDLAGRLLVGDRENNRVQILDRTGKWLGEVGGLHKPMAVEPTLDGGFLVTDHTPRLSQFSPAGVLVGRCRTFGTFGHGLGLRKSDGSIFIAEMAPDALTRLAPIF